MFKTSFSKHANLLYQNSISAMLHISAALPKEAKQLFTDLYDENKDLKERIINFQKQSEKLIKIAKKG
jgi:hypothetical protein